MTTFRAVALSASVLCAALVTVSCADAGPSRAQQTLTTNATAYTARPVSTVGVGVAATVIATYQNGADTAVTLERCYPDTPFPIYGVDLISPRSDEGAAYNPNWACVGHDHQIVVPAHGVRTDTIVLRGPNGYVYTADGGHFEGVLDGTFQLTYGEVSSNSFTVRTGAALGSMRPAR